MEKLRRSYRFGRQSHHRNRLKLSTRLKPRKDIEPMKVTRKQLEEIIREETEKILRGEPEEVPGLEEETTDETLDSGYFDQVKKTWKCPEGETMSSKSGKCEPNRVKPSLRQEQ